MQTPTYLKRILGTGGSLYFSIPAPIARRLRIIKGDHIAITATENSIVATPYNPNPTKNPKG